MSKKLRNLVVFVLITGWLFTLTVYGKNAMPVPAATPTAVTIGKLPALEAIKKLEELGDKDDVKDIKKALKASPDKNVELEDLTFAAPSGPKLYQYATQIFGFIPATAMTATGSNMLDVTDAGFITGDDTLKGKTIKVTLDRLRVADYPGDGEHLVLFEFYAQHQVTGLAEDLHFDQTYRAPEGQGAGVTGSPIFLGLKVTNEGVSFKFKTVNVSNEDDEKLLAFLNGDQFKNGLKLIDSINPLVPIVSGFATGIFKDIASKHKNVPVQDAEMGLDFSTVVTHAKLKEGSYIAIQGPPGPWDWSTWKFNRTSGEIVSTSDNTKMIPYNYIVFSISKMQ
jgi:hypothetical protein